MPEKRLKHPGGDVFTIELAEGESVGMILREVKGKISGGTFSAKTPEAALKLFHARIADEMAAGFVDPQRKAKPAGAKKKPRESQSRTPDRAAWQKWWKSLNAQWKAVLRDAAGGEPAKDGFRALANLRSLDAPEAGLDDLAALAMLQNLENLNLYGNGFADLKPLKKLKSLKSLQIDNCAEVEDLRPLSALPLLGELNISYTSAADLTPLRKMKSLKTLHIAGIQNMMDNWKAQLDKLRKALPACRVVTAE